MRIPKQMFFQLRKWIPDLFIIANEDTNESSSTLFAEFSADLALTKVNGNPWIEIANREILPKRKKIVISLSDLSNASYETLSKIHSIARFLKRAGFEIFISIENRLERYDLQLFDRNQIIKVNGMSKIEIQKTALANGIGSADDLFLIDDAKLNFNPKFLDYFQEQLESTEKQEPNDPSEIYVLKTANKKMLSEISFKNVGKLELLREHDREKAKKNVTLTELNEEVKKLKEPYSSIFKDYPKDIHYFVNEQNVSLSDLMQLNPKKRELLIQGIKNIFIRRIFYNLSFLEFATLSTEMIIKFFEIILQGSEDRLRFVDVFLKTPFFCINLLPFEKKQFFIDRAKDIFSLLDFKKNGWGTTVLLIPLLSVISLPSEIIEKLLNEPENPYFENFKYLLSSNLIDFSLISDEKIYYLIENIEKINRLCIERNGDKIEEGLIPISVLMLVPIEAIREIVSRCDDILAINHTRHIKLKEDNGGTILRLLRNCDSKIVDIFLMLQKAAQKAQVSDNFQCLYSLTLNQYCNSSDVGLNNSLKKSLFNIEELRVQESESLMDECSTVSRLEDGSYEIKHLESQKLTVLELYHYDEERLLKAPKLIELAINKIFIYNEIERIEKINLSLFPSLSKLKMNVSFHSDCVFDDQERCFPIFVGLTDNLIELEISGDDLSNIKALTKLIEASPNLKKILLDKTEIPDIDLFYFEKKYPFIQFEVIKDPYRQFDIDESVIADLNSCNIGNPDRVYETESSDLTSDFDTQYKSQKFSLSASCRHLNNNKPNRFERIRGKFIYTLSDNGEIEKLAPTEFYPCEIPVYQETLPSNDDYDFFRFDAEIHLKKDDKIQLKSLSSLDRLFQITLNGKALTSDDISIIKNNFGFYTITVENPSGLQGELSYIYDLPPDADKNLNQLPSELHLDELQTIISHIKSFPPDNTEKLSSSGNSSALQKLDAMYLEKKGACRHRVAVFMRQLTLLKAKYPLGSDEHQKYSQVHARITDRGGVHTNIELSIDNGKSFQCVELGGYTAKEIFEVEPEDKKQVEEQIKEKVQTQHAPDKDDGFDTGSAEKAKDQPKSKVHFSVKSATHVKRKTFPEMMRYIKDEKGENAFFCMRSPKDNNIAVEHIRAAAEGRPFFHINSPADLSTSLQRLLLDEKRETTLIQNPPAGLFYEFLLQHKNTSPPPVIVINWDNFALSDMVMFNSIIDTANRSVDNTPIPPGAFIIGLHSYNEKMMDFVRDTSFASRNKAGIHDFSSLSLEPLSNPIDVIDDASDENTATLIAHDSTQWRRLLLGKTEVYGSEIRWRDGQLLRCFLNPAISHIRFINPPSNCEEFDNFVLNLQAGLPITVLNQTISLHHKMQVTIIKQPIVPEHEILATKVLALPDDAYIINKINFELCLHSKKITDDGLLFSASGLIEAHQNKTLNLCICSDLSDSQWSLLFTYIKNYNVTLQLSITPEITIPSKIKYLPRSLSTQEASPKKTANVLIISDDVEKSVEIVQENNAEAIVVDISEVSLDDLFFKAKHKPTQEGFQFSQKFSDVWLRLCKGETVILKGYCSNDTLNCLATLFAPTPYFMVEGKKQLLPGKLILLANDELKKPNWIDVKEEKIRAENAASHIQSLYHAKESTVEKPMSLYTSLVILNYPALQKLS